ncbi:MAG: hypothetical protein GY847_12090 [Proteobacteria bacterium]|nr:hypothetical protein [Pseudomonadota bacterium]
MIIAVQNDIGKLAKVLVIPAKEAEILLEFIDFYEARFLLRNCFGQY